MRTTTFEARQRRRLQATRWVGGLIAAVMLLAVITPALFSVGP